MNYWLVVGSPKNWDIAFRNNNIWGLRETQKRLWDNLKENDRLLFYATSPIKGIIGFGTIRTKFKQNRPLWPDEIRNKKIIWPLRFEFDVKFSLPPDKWLTEKLVSSELMPRAGFQLLAEATASRLISSLMGTANYDTKEAELPTIQEPLANYTGTSKPEAKKPTTHNNIRETLVEIGKLQGFLAESEYPFDTGILDVVWRRVINSVPTYVFEIQVGGDIYHALGKLKHAYDLWNSHIFLVASEKDREKAEGLLSGTFHEIGDRIKFVELGIVEELYKRKKAYFDLEKELGI